jgi:predicted nucleic acid-binding Zn ribbon protein
MDDDDSPNCPGCAGRMTPRRSPPRRGLLPIHSYACERCGIVFTELATGAGATPERAIALHYECNAVSH